MRRSSKLAQYRTTKTREWCGSEISKFVENWTGLWEQNNRPSNSLRNAKWRIIYAIFGRKSTRFFGSSTALEIAL